MSKRDPDAEHVVAEQARGARRAMALRRSRSVASGYSPRT